MPPRSTVEYPVSGRHNPLYSAGRRAVTAVTPFTAN
jgi:hypothetical protein